LEIKMLDFETLRVIWWLILGTLLIGFAIMDGFDLGVGTIFRFAGQTDEERQALLASIEPVWEGNQVWFVLAGGAVFAAWPVLYAASFSGLYLAMFMLLVALILRPVGFTYRNQLTDARWRDMWDWALLVGGAVPALLFGVAIGNLFLGLPFHFDELHRSVYTGNFLDLLHPYALLTGLVSLSMLVMHGCTYAALKVGEPMATRAVSVGRCAALTFCAAFIVAGSWVSVVMDGHHIVPGITQTMSAEAAAEYVSVGQGAWLANYEAHPILWMFPVAALLSALSTRALLGSTRFRSAAFVTSCLTQAATILTAGIALFPFLMPSSTHPNEGLTIWNASSSQKTLQIMLIAVVLFLPIVLAYTAWVFRVLRGRITLEEIRRHSGLY
jgi:cytochrome d ubiquinol oxidase subunit II